MPLDRPCDVHAPLRRAASVNMRRRGLAGVSRAALSPAELNHTPIRSCCGLISSLAISLLRGTNDLSRSRGKDAPPRGVQRHLLTVRASTREAKDMGVTVGTPGHPFGRALECRRPPLERSLPARSALRNPRATIRYESYLGAVELEYAAHIIRGFVTAAPLRVLRLVARVTFGFPGQAASVLGPCWCVVEMIAGTSVAPRAAPFPPYLELPPISAFSPSP